MRFASGYIDSAALILEAYKGENPFHIFLKEHFRKHKKFGSKDRKFIAEACYAYFRLGKALTDIETKEKIVAALYLCTDFENWKSLQPDWPLKLTTAERIIFLNKEYSQFLLTEIFSLHQHLSDDIDVENWQLSHLIQPDLFLRIRPGFEKKVSEKLNASGIHYVSDNYKNCIRLNNSSAVTEVLEVNREVVIQDRSSQMVADFFPTDKVTTVWDCCAASGGKSILANDCLGNIRLYVTDVRQPILHNLQARFRTAGIVNYKAEVKDVSDANIRLSDKKFDFIICDVPCTGSGTWSRTPEQLMYFTEDRIQYYSNLQRKIISNSVKSLHKGSFLLYITCSVFKEENEEQVFFIQQHLNLELIKSKIIKGYNDKADTMFAALFKQL